MAAATAAVMEVAVTEVGLAAAAQVAGLAAAATAGVLEVVEMVAVTAAVLGVAKVVALQAGRYKIPTRNVAKASFISFVDCCSCGRLKNGNESGQVNSARAVQPGTAAQRRRDG